MELSVPAVMDPSYASPQDNLQKIQYIRNKNPAGLQRRKKKNKKKIPQWNTGLTPATKSPRK